MKTNSSFGSVFLLLFAVVLGVAAIIYGIQYFEIDPGGITEPRGEVSFGATSKLGWILTASFFALVVVASLIRRFYYKISGR